jgi:hypothetical protein
MHGAHREFPKQAQPGGLPAVTPGCVRETGRGRPLLRNPLTCPPLCPCHHLQLRPCCLQARFPLPPPATVSLLWASKFSLTPTCYVCLLWTSNRQTPQQHTSAQCWGLMAGSYVKPITYGTKSIILGAKRCVHCVATSPIKCMHMPHVPRLAWFAAALP